MSSVLILQCNDYDPEKIREVLERGLDKLGGIESYISPSDNVLLKPNLLTSAAPEEAVCTHPGVIEAVINIVKKTGADITVGDSPGFGSTESVAKSAGILDVCKKTGIELTAFKNPVSVSFPEGKREKNFKIDTAVLEADKIINLPKFKLHGLTGFTGAIKNMFGCVPGTRKSSWHLRYPSKTAFGQALVDVYSFIKPTLNIMDAVVGMEGQGPRSGTPKELGMLLVSRDGVALDAVSTRIIGIEPFDILTTRYAYQRSMGEARIDNLDVAGIPLSEAIVPDFHHGFKKSFFRQLPLIREMVHKKSRKLPHIDKSNCKKCAVCVKICPQKIIAMSEDFPEIDYSRCIKCYCCQELCPYAAIELKDKRDIKDTK